MNAVTFNFPESPSKLSEAAFIAQFGAVYEHSPWVAERTWQSGLDSTHDAVSTLVAAFAETLANATHEEQLALIKAHPDLAGRAAIDGELTRHSTDEQASARLNACTAEEFERFQSLNTAYQAKFGFPFVMAVRDSNRHAILAALEQRMNNTLDEEFACALNEINKIARLRLEAMAGT
jgi:OHCU decarboxylase